MPRWRTGMRSRMMKIGTLARKTGLTVRTLHYYDEIGLLSPSRRSEAGYRLYGPDDVARLQQILSLRQIGFSLDAIRQYLEQPSFSPYRIIQLHLTRLKEQIDLQQQLQKRLEALAAYVRSAEAIPVDEFIQTIEVMTMIEKYYTEEQLEALKQRAEALGEEHIRQAEADWATLIEEVRAEMARDADPSSEPVQQLARRWKGLIEAFTGGDPGITSSLRTMYEQEGPEKASRNMLDGEVMAYMGRALKTLSA